MEVRLTHKRHIKKTGNIYLRYYANDAGTNPDYYIHVNNGKPEYILKRTKDENGDLDKDYRIKYEQLPEQVKQFINI
jgi:phage anti-repressor protein